MHFFSDAGASHTAKSQLQNWSCATLYEINIKFIIQCFMEGCYNIIAASPAPRPILVLCQNLKSPFAPSSAV